MTRWIAVLLAVAAVSGATRASAQESAPGPGKVVITIIPGGATFFTEASDNPQAPSFGNYDLGGAAAIHFNRFLAVEGELSGAIGVSQSMQVGTFAFDGKSPHLLNYSGNLVASLPTGKSVVATVTTRVSPRWHVSAGSLMLDLPLVEDGPPPISWDG